MTPTLSDMDLNSKMTNLGIGTQDQGTPSISTAGACDDMDNGNRVQDKVSISTQVDEVQLNSEQLDLDRNAIANASGPSSNGLSDVNVYKDGGLTLSYDPKDISKIVKTKTTIITIVKTRKIGNATNGATPGPEPNMQPLINYDLLAARVIEIDLIISVLWFMLLAIYLGIIVLRFIGYIEIDCPDSELERIQFVGHRFLYESVLVLVLQAGVYSKSLAYCGSWILLRLVVLLLDFIVAVYIFGWYWYWSYMIYRIITIAFITAFGFHIYRNRN